MIKALLEAKDLNLYKKLLRVLGDYNDKFPATGVSKMFKAAVEKGMTIIPKEKRAVEILSHVLMTDDSVPAAVTRLLNARFADLDVPCKPIYKNGNVKEVAFWARDGQVSDKVLSLLGFEKSGGYWSDAEGKKVTLVDMKSTT